MKLIQGLTDQPKQQTAIVLADGMRANLYLEYRPNQIGWSYNVSLGDFAANGRRLVTGPNVLRQFRELIPFGIAVVTKADAEPLNQTDFIDGTVTLYLLDAADVALIEATIYPGN